MDQHSAPQPVYLDHNASTPVDPRVREAMLPWLSATAGNPGSPHAWGARAREAVARAREQVAGLLGCDPEEIILTSGGSESCNHAVKGCAWARRREGRHLIASAIEHPAVLAAVRWLADDGWRASLAPVDGRGVLDVEALAGLLEPDTILVAVMHANNETGVLQPLDAVAARLRGHGAWLFADCAQSAGKVPVRVRELGVDLAGLAGHKLYAPKGVGALYVRRGLRPENLIHGAGQEAGRRAGTEAVAQAVALGEACRLAASDLAAEMARLGMLRDRFAAHVRRLAPQAVIHGEGAPRLPGTLSVALPGHPAGAVLERLQDHLAASAGAACHGAGAKASGVLAAMGVAPELAACTIRFSLGRPTTADDIDRAAGLLARAL